MSKFKNTINATSGSQLELMLKKNEAKAQELTMTWIDKWNNIYIGGYTSSYVYMSPYNPNTGGSWSEFYSIVDTGSIYPKGFSISQNGWIAIAGSDGNAYLYKNSFNGIYDIDININQINTIS